MLPALVALYLLVTVAIGLAAARRVKSSADFAIAGRSLPLVMIVTTTFATWFGSETVLGISARFVQGGLNAYQVTLVGAFVPLVFGLYWKRATTQGAVMSIAPGILTWVMFFPQLTQWGEVFPGQLAGLLAALFGMVFGSLGPQLM